MVTGLPEHIVKRLEWRNGCLEWQGSRNPDGYGQVRHGGKVVRVHRLAYEALTGERPGDLEVLHSCDNPPCANIEHLRLGTHSDNMQDMHRRNRARAGFHKLKPGDPQRIREMYATGKWTQQGLAEEFKVRKFTIWKIVHELTVVE